MDLRVKRLAKKSRHRVETIDSVFRLMDNRIDLTQWTLDFADQYNLDPIHAAKQLDRLHDIRGRKESV